jgi:hypothetical protein
MSEPSTSHDGRAPRPRRVQLRARLLAAVAALALATVAVEASTAATMPEPPGAAAAAHTGHVLAAAVREFYSLRRLAWRTLRAGGGGSGRLPVAMAAARVRTSSSPGSWTLLLAGLAGACAIGRRRLAARGSRRIPRLGPPRT